MKIALNFLVKGSERFSALLKYKTARLQYISGQLTPWPENTKRTGNYTIPLSTCSYVDFQNTNFVVVILDSLFKSGKSGTQPYCVIPGTFSVPCLGQLDREPKQQETLNSRLSQNLPQVWYCNKDSGPWSEMMNR